MEYRQLGNSGLKVPVLSFGTATFAGGAHDGSWGNTEVDEASRLVDIALEAGVNFFDTADIYSAGRAEEVLGKVIAKRRDDLIIGTKATFRSGDGLNDVGSSRFHLVRALEGSLKRLGTDHVDVYYLHGFDGATPLEETLSTLDEFVRSGKVRYIGCSNFSGWQLMKALSISERYGWAKHVAHQAHYSLAAREFEWELMPLGVDQNVGTVVWSPLSQGRLTGKVRRGQPVPSDSRLTAGSEVQQSGNEETLYTIVEALDAVAEETGKSLSQVSLNWLLQRPTISSIIFGARNEAQLRENFGAVGWNLSADQVARLDAASKTTPTYPYWHQRNFERAAFATQV
ncbi:MAG: aldo/keto reductase [Glaciihabitans sp.]|nr:aldo/keto reductase [Glaciihabitans sp.]